ncbi:MAG: carboxypeptidase-like regulatory domain-containing protein, partial [Terracidiphilus sp.]
MSQRKAKLAVAVVFAALAVAMAPLAKQGNSFIAQAQNLGQRSVSGAVVDADANPVAGATVFLKNQKTKAIRSYTS